jgi:hypothetical protein
MMELPCSHCCPSPIASIAFLGYSAAVPGQVRGGRGDEPTSAGREEEGAGKDHPDMLTSIYCLAFLLHSQKQYNDASILYQRACAGYEEKLGLS